MIIYESHQDWDLFHRKMSDIFGIEYQSRDMPDIPIEPSEKSFLGGTLGAGIPKPGTSAAMMGNTRRRGKKFSEESRARVSIARIGNKNRLGTLHSEEMKLIIAERTSAALKGKPKKTIQCPHCAKVGGAGNMKRYHFDSCKAK